MINDNSDLQNGADIPYSERQLIQRAINSQYPRCDEPAQQRWVLVKRLFGTGRNVSTLICWKYGFDAEKLVEHRGSELT